MKSNWGHTSESLELVPCREFMGPPGSGAALAQPFEVSMNGQVRLITCLPLLRPFAENCLQIRKSDASASS